MAGLEEELSQLPWLPPPPGPRAAAGEQMIDCSDGAVGQEMPSVSEVSGVCTMGMELEGCGAYGNNNDNVHDQLVAILSPWVEHDV